MTGSFFSQSHVFDSSRGEFVSEKHRRIAEIISDYDPNLILCYIPPADRTAEDTMPFAVAYRRPDGSLEEVCLLREDEVDETLLARLWMNDTRKNDPLDYLEKLETAREALRLKEEVEKQEEAAEMAKFMIRSPLHTINLGGGRVVRT